MTRSTRAWPRLLSPPRTRTGSRRAPGLSNRATRRLTLERLEDRLLLAMAQDLGPLRLVAPIFTPNGTVWTATGNTVTIGFTPTPGEDLHALVQVRLATGTTPGTLTFDPTVAPAKFTVTDGVLESVVQGGLPIPVWQTPDTVTPVDFNVLQLTSAAGLALADAKPFTVARVSFSPTKILLADPTGGSTADSLIQLQGSLGLPDLPIATLSTLQPVVDGTNFVLIQDSGISLTGARLAASDPTMNLAGLTGLGLSLSLGYTSAGGHDTFSVSGGLLLSSKPQGTSQQSALIQVGANLALSFTDGDLTSLGFDITAAFKLFGLTVSTLPGRPLHFDFNFTTQQYEIWGGLQATFPDAAQSNIELKLGGPGNPGLIFRGGELTALNATVDASFSLGGIKATTQGDGLNFIYKTDEGVFKMWGGLTMQVPTAGGKTTSLSAQMGDSSSPGLILKNGKLTQIELALSGQIDVYGLTLSVTGAGLKYQTNTQDGHDEFDLFGTVKAQELWQASVTLGASSQPGIVIRDGHFALDNLRIMLANVNLGAFKVQNFVVAYSAGAAADFTLSVTLELVFPGGWAVGGSVTLDDGHVADVSVFYAAVSGNGIPVGDTGLYVQYIDASIQNLTDPSEISVTGDIDFAYGDTVSLLGHDVSLFTASGQFYVTKDELVVQMHSFTGSYQVGTGGNGRPLYRGVLGEGSGTLTLDWGQKYYSLAASWTYLDDTFEFDGVFAFDDSGDLVVGGRARVNVPGEVPFIGGDTLGDIDFLFEFHPHDLDHSFFAAWTHVHVLFVHIDIGLRFSLDKHLSVIGGSTIDAYADCISNPEMCLDGQAAYTYFSAYQAPAGATAATLTAAWPSPGGAQTVSVTLPNGQVIPQSQFSAANGISLVPSLNSSTRLAVNIAGSSSNPDIILPPGSYTLTLTSSVNYPHDQVTFTSLFSYPSPTVALAQPLPPPGPDCSIPVTLSGTVDEGFKDQTKVTLYVDTGNDPDHRHGVPVAGATNQSITTDGHGHWMLTLPLDTSGLVPGSTYYAYAVINDGTNTPVACPYSAAIHFEPELSGRVTDAAHGNVPVSGQLVYLDLNHNGEYDPPVFDQNGHLVRPGEPASFTSAQGWYAFCDLAPGQAYDVALVVPPSYQLDTTNPANTNPRQGVVYDGTHAVAESFALDKLAAISGTVYLDLDQDGQDDPTDPGLPTWVLFLDTNGNGLRDAGETTAATDGSGHYSFFALTPRTTYTVRVAVPPGYYQTAPATGYTVTLGNDPFEQVTGKDFGILAYSSISGTVGGYGLNGGTLDSQASPRQGWTVRLLQPAVDINAGGGSYGPYQPDRGFSGGDIFYNSQAIDTSAVVGPAPLYVYQTLRYGPDFTYTVSGLTPSAPYVVRLHFADNYCTEPGQRIFDVTVNGQVLLSRYDVAGLAGGNNKAIAAAVPAAADAAGRIVLHFTGVVGDALVNGIEVSSLAATTTTDDAGRYAFGGFAQVNIAAGGSAAGLYLSDRDFSGGQAVTVASAVDTTQIADPAPQAVYQANRFGKDFTYAVTGLVPNSPYDVRLHFAETYWTAPGQRVFDVAVNGQPALVDFDIVAAAGGAAIANAQDVDALSDANGVITLHFTADVDNAQVNGLQLRRTIPFGRSGAGVAAAPSGLRAGHYSVLVDLPARWRQLAPFGSAFRLTTPSGADVNTFPTYPFLKPNPVALVAADFLDNGRPDVAMLDNNLAEYVAGGPVRFFPGGQIATSIDPSLFFFDHPQYLLAGDFYGTGRQDMAVIGAFGQLDGLKNQGGGTFLADYSQPAVPLQPYPIYGAVAGRFTGAGHQVTALFLGEFQVHLDVLSLSPQKAPVDTVLPVGLQPGLLATADFNVDGRLDVLVGDNGGSPLIAYNDGTGAFALRSTAPLPSGGIVFAGDLNGDTIPDIGLFDSQGRLHYALQDAAANFTDVPTDVVTPGVIVGPIALTDMDGDLRPDLVWLTQGAYGGPNPVVVVALNTGQDGALFSAAHTSAWPLAAGAVLGLLTTPFGRNALGLPHLAAADNAFSDPSNPFSQIHGQLEALRNVTLIYAAPYVLDPVGVDLVGQDFTVANLGQLSGRVFDDPARDGRNLPARSGRAGVTVFVDLDRDGRLDPGEPSVVTGPDGVFAFDGLAPGSYSLRLLPGAGRTLTAAGPVREVTVRAGHPIAGLDFGTAVGRDVMWTIPAGSMPGEWTVLRNGDRLELFDTMLGTVASEPLAELASVTVVEPAGGGRLTADVAGGGFFRLPGGLHIVGSPRPDDSVRILLGAGDNQATLYDGRADVDAGLSIRWAAVEVVDLHTRDGQDRVAVQPQAAAVVVDAGPPAAAPGDQLTVLGQGHGPRLAALDAGAGLWTFADAAPVAFRGVETLTPGDYVWTLYQELLGRAPDEAGHAWWRAALDQGLSREQLVRSLWNSPEHRALQVEALYQRYLHRSADDAGRAVWVMAMLHGASEAEVAVALLTSAEYAQGHADDTAFVAGLYRDVLGRGPDPAGLAAWQAAAGASSWAAAAAAFLTASEARSVLLDRLYQDYLGRPADPAGRAVWLGALAADRMTPDQVAAAILTSDEAFAATL